MRRVTGTVLLGLGIALAVFAAGLRFYATPIATNIPYDLDKSTTVAEAKNAKYLDPSTGQIKTGTVQSITEVVPQPVVTRDKQKSGDLPNTAVVWDVYSTAKAGSTVIDASTVELALDRKSGAAIDWAGTFVNNNGQQSKAKFAGQSYKLPFNAEKKSYAFWDDSLGKTVDIAFTGEETVSGMKAYRYDQTIPATKIGFDAQTLVLLSAVFGGNKGGDVYYSNTRTIWVEPVTGQFLNVREQRKLEFRGGNGTNVSLLDGDFSYTADSMKTSADSIKSNHDKLVLVSTTLPAGAGGLGLILLIIGIILLATGRKPTDDAAAATDTTGVTTGAPTAS